MAGDAGRTRHTVADDRLRRSQRRRSPLTEGELNLFSLSLSLSLSLYCRSGFGPHSLGHQRDRRQ